MLFVLALVLWLRGGTGFKWEILTSKVINEEFFDKVDQAVPVESLRTQEGHWQIVKRIIPSEQK